MPFPLPTAVFTGLSQTSEGSILACLPSSSFPSSIFSHLLSSPESETPRFPGQPPHPILVYPLTSAWLAGCVWFATLSQIWPALSGFGGTPRMLTCSEGAEWTRAHLPGCSPGASRALEKVPSSETSASGGGSGCVSAMVS